MNRPSLSLLLVALTSLSVILCGCNQKDERTLEKEQSSGVVLVQNQSYYEVVLSNGESLFFSGIDDSGEIQGLSFSADSVSLATSYGTGFFVNDAGVIATNNHVVNSTAEMKSVTRSIGKIIETLKRSLQFAYRSLENEYDELSYAYQIANINPDISYADFYAIRDARDAKAEEMREAESAFHELNNLRPDDSEIKYHNQISIAFNDTHVTKKSDFSECVVLRSDEKNDLALIQLKDKRTPAGKYIFSPAPEDPFESYSLTDKIVAKIKEDKNNRLYMHGFNLGPALALTEEGLKSQFTNGTVSQHTTDRLMYTIPALPGSSGSPVVNRNGELVAINFAGLNGTQGFNYGVRVKHLKKLMESE